MSSRPYGLVNPVHQGFTYTCTLSMYANRDNGNLDAALQPHAGLNRQRRVVPLEGQNGF